MNSDASNFQSRDGSRFDLWRSRGSVAAGASRTVARTFPAVVDYHSPCRPSIRPDDAIPYRVVHAFLAGEDNDFYNHSGIDFAMTLRAMGLDILH